MSWSRFTALVEAKIIEAGPGAAAARARAAAMARFVRTGRVTEHGIRSVYARAEAGDAVCFTAMVDRIAHLLAEAGDTDTVREQDLHPSQNDADEPEGMRGDPGVFSTAGARIIAAALGRVDPGRLLPRGTLYVHLSQDALNGATGRRTSACACACTCDPTGAATTAPEGALPELPGRPGPPVPVEFGPPARRGVARVEGVGPVTVDQAAQFLAHRNVRTLQPRPAVYLWRSPHGYWWRVDHLGTHRLGPETTRGQPPL